MVGLVRLLFGLFVGAPQVGAAAPGSLFTPFVAKVVVRRGGRTRRAKLFYLRDRVGKAVRLTEAKRKDKRDDAQSGQTEEAAPAPRGKAKNKAETPELAASAT